jgi:hypothetical protein
MRQTTREEPRMDHADSAGAHPGLARRSIMLKLLYTTAQARVALG